MECYVGSASTEASKRVALKRLLWDFIGSEFGSVALALPPSGLERRSSGGSPVCGPLAGGVNGLGA